MNLLQLITWIIANQKSIIEFVNLLMTILEMFENRDKLAQAQVSELTAEGGLFGASNYPELAATLQANGSRLSDLVELLLNNIDKLEQLIVIVKQLLELFHFVDDE